MDENKVKALDSVMVQIEKQYGKGSIMRLGDSAGDTTVEALPTGCFALDLAIGIGGLPFDVAAGRDGEDAGVPRDQVFDVDVVGRLDQFGAPVVAEFLFHRDQFAFDDLAHSAVVG